MEVSLPRTHNWGHPGDEFLGDQFYEVFGCAEPVGERFSQPGYRPPAEPVRIGRLLAREREWSLELGPRARGTEGGIDKEIEVASLVRLEDVLHVERLVAASRNGSSSSVFG